MLKGFISNHFIIYRAFLLENSRVIEHNKNGYRDFISIQATHKTGLDGWSFLPLVH
jgi:hypothetical protein